MGNRLSRGRSYARKGQVISLEVVPGQVRSTVQGSRARPYKITIGLAPFTPLVWARAEIALSEQALPAAKLLAGDVPPELEDIFADAGAPLFPQQVDDLDQSCSCPDWEVPCKHLAATFYLLAEAFDDDPFLILRWRGREREALLTRLRELRGESGPADGTASGAPLSAVGSALALTGLSWPGDRLERFWQPPPPLPTPPAVLAAAPDVLLRQLPTPAAAIGGETLLEQLRAAYRVDRGDTG